VELQLKTKGSRRWVLGWIVLAGICSAVLLRAVTYQLSPVAPGDIQNITWASGDITWSMNPSNSIVYSSPETLASGEELQSVLAGAFALWSGAQYQGTKVNTLHFTQVADNAQTTFVSGDCVNSIGFTQDLGATGVIAETVVTSYSNATTPFPYPCSTGKPLRICPSPLEVCISDADIEFNTRYDFYTPSYANPPGSLFDLQTVATHEIGHLLGLDHSGLANAVMYPYGDRGTGGVKYTLALDDVIGSAALYPSNAILGLTGGIKGAVTVDGSAAFGAHVVAIDSATGNVVTDTLTDPSGIYHLRVFQGNYYVLVLPLATNTSGDSGTNGVTSIENYQGMAGAHSGATVQTNFGGAYY